MWKDLLDKGKDLFDQGKCKVNLHDGEWVYESEASCAQAQVCKRCGETSTRVKHVWGEWEYAAPDSCEQVQRCQRCGQESTGLKTAVKNVFVNHTWSEWTRVASDSCEETRVCQRCHKLEQRALHDWGDWEFIEPNACDQQRECRHCRAEEKRLGHQWVESDPDVYDPYIVGLRRLLREVRNSQQLYAEALVLEQRLIENITRSRMYGETDTNKAERAQIIAGLNQFTRAAIRQTFSQLVDLIRLIRSPDDRWLAVDSSGRPVRFCRRCGDIAQYTPAQAGR